METLLKDRNPPDGSDSLYRVLTLTANSYSLYRVLTLTAKPTRKLSWKIEVLLTALTAYIRFSPWRLSLHGDSPKR